MTTPIATNSLSRQAVHHEADASARLLKAAQAFESILWSQVADAMLAAGPAPQSLGFGGSVYQRMLWREVAKSDFGAVNQGLTETLVERLARGQGIPSVAPTVSTGLMQAIEQARAGVAHRVPVSALPTNTSATGGMAKVGANHQVGPSVTAWFHRIWGAVQAAADKLGVPAKAILAQSALETNWGEALPGHNLFGIKAHGGGSSTRLATAEYAGGAWRHVTAAFQVYTSSLAAANDYVQVIQRNHSRAVGAPTVASFARALQESGYATDPHYAAKIEAVARSPRMQSLMAQAHHKPPAASGATAI